MVAPGSTPSCAPWQQYMAANPPLPATQLPNHGFCTPGTHCQHPHQNCASSCSFGGIPPFPGCTTTPAPGPFSLTQLPSTCQQILPQHTSAPPALASGYERAYGHFYQPPTPTSGLASAFNQVATNPSQLVQEPALAQRTAAPWMFDVSQQTLASGAPGAPQQAPAPPTLAGLAALPPFPPSPLHLGYGSQALRAACEMAT